MFNIDKESLLNLNEAMRKTIINMNYDNPVEISAFASSLVSVGNQINIELVHKIAEKEKHDEKEDV